MAGHVRGCARRSRSGTRPLRGCARRDRPLRGWPPRPQAGVEPVPLRAVVALAPVADLRLAYQLNLSNGAVAEFLGGSPETVPDRYDEACPTIKSAAVRRVVVHGSDDDTVPISISRAFLEAAKNDPEPPPLVEIPGAGHMDLIDPESPACAKVLEIVVDLS